MIAVSIERTAIWEWDCTAKVGPQDICGHRIRMHEDEMKDFVDSDEISRQCPECGYGFTANQFRGECTTGQTVVIRIEG